MADTDSSAMEVSEREGAEALNRCFIIGPIGNKFAPLGSPPREAYEEALEVFESVIVPACQAFGLDPIRSDQIAVSGAITEQVLQHLYNDEIVIADVSGGNPNVMYELGLRHTRNLLTIVIGEYGQLPFDIADVRTIQFSKSARGLIDARKGLERAIQAGLAELPEPIAATRIWSSGSAAGSEVVVATAGGDEPNAIDVDEAYFEEKGLVERLAAMEDAFPVLTQISEEIGSVLTELGEVASDSSTELNVVNATSPSVKARLAVIAKFARALQVPADELALQTKRFETQMSDMDEEVVGLLSFLEKHPETADIDTFLDSIIEMAKSTRESMENIGAFASIVESLGDLSRMLKRPARQISDAVKVMMNSVTYTDDWDNRARRLKQLRSSAA